MNLIDDGSTKALVGKLGVFVGQDYVGKLEFTINKKIPAGKIPAFGTTYSRTTYDKLWQYIQEHPDMMLSETDWQAYSSAHNGQVPFYSDGDGSTTFRTPCLKGIVEGAVSLDEVGTNTDAGLPNITGYIQAGAGETDQTARGYGVVRYVGGAFYGDQEVQFSPTGYQGSYPSGPTYQYTRMDASRSNSIYGKSSTVQPPTIVGMWLITAYVAVTNVTSTTLDNIASGLTELETRNNISTFTSLDQLGIKRGEETLLSIAKALPYNSKLMYFVNKETGYADIYPHVSIVDTNSWYGVVTAEKPHVDNCIFRFHSYVIGKPFYSREWIKHVSMTTDGSADVDNKLWQEQCYILKRIEDIGLKKDTLTLQDIATNLPYNTTLQFYVQPSDGYPSGIFPASYGSLRATRIANSRGVIFEFFSFAGPPTHPNYNIEYYLANTITTNTTSIIWTYIGGSFEDTIIKSYESNTTLARYEKYKSGLVHMISFMNFPASTAYADFTPLIPLKKVYNCIAKNCYFEAVTSNTPIRIFEWCMGGTSGGATVDTSGLINGKIRILTDKTVSSTDGMILDIWGLAKE